MASAEVATLFYGNQYIYEAGSATCVRNTTKSIIQARSEGKNLQEFFHNTLKELGEYRHKIAIAQESDDDGFGTLRFGTVQTTFSFLINRDYYTAYAQRMLDRFAKLSTLPYKETTSCSGIKSTFELEELTPVVLASREWDKPYEKTFFLKFYLPLRIAGLSHVDAIRKFSEQFPKDYEKNAMIEMLSLYKQEIPLQSDVDYKIFSATCSEVIEGKPLTLSRYLTWIHPLKLEDSRVMIIHQDIFLSEITLKNCAKIFEKAVLWRKESEDLSALKNTMGEWCYKICHANLFLRGGPTIVGWIEKAVYASHQLTLVRKREVDLDLEVLTSFNFTEFLESYHANTVLE